MRLDLNSPSVAKYHWSTLVCRFSAAAPVGRRTFLETMAALFGGVANWKTDEEFRATAALLHEIVHLAQDLTTGIGHSDHLTHVVQDNNALHLAALAAVRDGEFVRVPYEEKTFVAEMQEQLLYHPFAMLTPERRDRLRAMLEKDVGKPIDDEFLFDISTQSLLEADAALTVVSNLQRLDMTDAQSEILARNISLCDPKALGPEYWMPSAHLGTVISHHAGVEDEQLEIVLPRVFGVFVDCALAFPPRSWLQSREEDPDNYDPGIKYARLMLAFQKLSGATIDRFWKALVANRIEDAERVLLEHIGYPYPSSREIYEVWLEAFEAQDRMSPVDELRSTACRYRLDHGVFAIERGIDLLADQKAPVFLLHKDAGFFKTDWNLRVVDPQKDADLIFALVDRLCVMDLVDFLYQTGEFRCPHADADTCAVVEDRCSAGFVDLAQFPETPRCFARATLARCGMIFPQP